VDPASHHFEWVRHFSLDYSAMPIPAAPSLEFVGGHAVGNQFTLRSSRTGLVGGVLKGHGFSRAAMAAKIAGL
jgi:hypothetical protein